MSDDKPTTISDELYQRAQASIDAATERVSRQPRPGTTNALTIEAIAILNGEADTHQIARLIKKTTFDTSAILHGLMRRKLVKVSGHRYARSGGKPIKVWRAI